MHALIDTIRDLYPDKTQIALHEPVFLGNEQAYTRNAIDSTFVSSVGAYVDQFEHDLAAYTSAEGVVAVVNGTSALHAALHAIGVAANDLVITQSLSFVATANAISYTGAEPVFVDIERPTLGLSPQALREFLETECFYDDFGETRHKKTNKHVKACVPMHTFGHPCRIDIISAICKDWNIELIEDAAESVGSTYLGRHTGTFGAIGAVSLNGNKIITAGAGGALLTNQARRQRLKHLTTTAKIPHPWGFQHDEVGFNYRMPNLNAALACAQLEQLDAFVNNKRKIATVLAETCDQLNLEFVVEPEGARSNYWLNAILVESLSERDNLIQALHQSDIMVRPAWDPLHTLPMYQHCIRMDLTETQSIFERLISLPSGFSKAIQ